MTFTGGTGALAGTTGQIRLRGQLDPIEGTTSGDYLGRICTSALPEAGQEDTALSEAEPPRYKRVVQWRSLAKD